MSAYCMSRLMLSCCVVHGIDPCLYVCKLQYAPGLRFPTSVQLLRIPIHDKSLFCKTFMLRWSSWFCIDLHAAHKLSMHSNCYGRTTVPEMPMWQYVVLTSCILKRVFTILSLWCTVLASCKLFVMHFKLSWTLNPDSKCVQKATSEVKQL